MLKSTRLLAIAIAIIICNFTGVKAQDNIPQKQLFDYNWKFFPGDAPNAAAANYDDNGWRNLDLPHDWSIEGKLDQKNPMSGAGGYFPAGIGWYRKKFNASSNWQGKRITIYFEGVYMNSEIGRAHV